jgi:hypothetical protein
MLWYFSNFKPIKVISPLFTNFPTLTISTLARASFRVCGFLAFIMIINKQLKTIPFDKLYEVYEDAATAAVNGLDQYYEDQYQTQIQQLEQKYSSNSEAPSEVGFGDQVDRPQYDRAEAKRKAGQKAAVDIWMPRYKLGSLLISVMPQIMAHLANKPFRRAEIVTAEGRIDGTKMLKSAFDFSSEWERGLYIFLMLDSRSAYLPSQYKGEGTQFCSLVPLIPYAFKLHHKIPYSSWDRSTLKWVVNVSLREAMLHTGTYTREELLFARDLGLIYQSGPKRGESRNPQSTFKLWSTKGGCLQGVPHLAQVMLTQIWCAHPSSRTPYMVLDPNNWDNMPAPLITENIFMSTNKAAQSIDDSNDLPW